MTFSQNISKLAFCGDSNTFSIYGRTNSAYEFIHQEPIGQFVLEIAIDPHEYYMVIETTGSIQTYYRCPDECKSCFFPNNCSACIDGHELKNGKCLRDNRLSHCVRDEFVKEDICREYCARECKTCDQNKHDCIECADLHEKGDEGKCEVISTLSIFTSFRPFVNMIRRRGTKWIFMMVDDLWLYQTTSQSTMGSSR